MKYKKEILYILGMIVLAIIGNAIWDKIGCRIYDKSITIMMNIFTGLSKSYIDSIYSQVRFGNSEIFSTLPYVFFAAIYMVFPWFLIATYFSVAKKLENKIKGIEEKKSKEEVIQKLKRRKTIMLILAIFFLYSTIRMASFVVRDSIRYDAVNYIVTSIDIVAPKISNDKLLQLKAKYRQIDTKEKFNQIVKELNDIAIKNDLKLPEFKYLKLK